MARRETKVLSDHKAPLVLKVLPGHRVSKESQAILDLLVRLGCKAQRETRETPVLQVQRERQVQQVLLVQRGRKARKA